MKALMGGLFGRMLAYLVLGLGFILLFRGFSRSDVLQGVLGGGLVLGGTYLMVRARLSQFAPILPAPRGNKEGNAGDPVDRSGQGG